MIDYILIFIVLTLVSIVYLKLADKLNIIDKPNHRSSHTSPTIRGGGILFFLVILIFFVSSRFQYPYFVLGVSLIAIVSFVDDIITLSSSFRLPFQFLAIALCLYQIGYSPNDFLVLIPLLIVGVGFINIYNFMDGINGITGLYSIASLLGILFINIRENIVDNNLIVYSLISLVVFGLYNFRKKARMFAGDIGSISIAVLLFFIGVYFIKELKAPVIILLVAVYGADTILTMIYRKSIGESLIQAHRLHIYQKMVHTLNLSHLKVSTIYVLIQMVINSIVYYTYDLKLLYQCFIIIIISVVLAFSYYITFKSIEKKKKFLIK
ncbi:MraY family glycosyltransferase [Tenacibaculum caenipelagi]|uniref:UDP-N-acetylmuramyl pentapeptide phosphotransferase/UDP-N-acetylglucosamine-1-phosphate transferase n=1 Tax=Tenacibaculum caenipelagi TaxID=1325435 RepID=A0A4R6TGL0_9FLAO|nr:glycosyltransferase family 4 protein [Tenacibaculum caenipelagi]TDQ24092.1 UDP-N-acetylmuramyl pentapeptide phosphotransferase/UDP-N-acetylglucosamine-1-phosphate transferase [Tenacibaculum caenipelagi]